MKQLLNHKDNDLNKEFAQIYSEIDKKSIFPIGTVLLHPAGQLVTGTVITQNPPPGWLVCIGTLQAVARYPALFKVLNNNYNDGTGPAGATGSPTNFYLPSIAPILAINPVGANSLLYYIIKAE